MFAPPGFSNLHVVIATATADATADPQANQGGVWASSDDGATWTHIVPGSPCPNAPTSAFGIAFLPPTTAYVATDCGLLSSAGFGGAAWTQPSSWNRLYASPAMSVSVLSSTPTSIVIDVCRQGGGLDRSLDGGATWRGVRPRPDCQSPHSVAVSPLDSSVVLATSGGTVIESDDGGLTWPIDLQANSTSTRPKFVVTNRAADQNVAHFDLYYAGRLVTCSNAAVAVTGQRCPTNTTGAPWSFIPNVPNTNMNHDINGVAVSRRTDNCAVYEVSDFGVLRKGAALPANFCGDPAAWTLAGNSGAGFGAQQIYQVAGQVQFPISGGGVSISGFTTLFFGTMDNLDWANHDAGVSGWQGFGAEGSFLQALNDTSLAAQAADLALTLVDFGGGGFAAKKVVPNIASGAWTNFQPWTGITPPGNGAPPFLVSAHTYVQWSGTTLFLTQDNGQSWVSVGTLPTGFTTFSGIQVAKTRGGPAIYEMVADSTGKQGIALLAHIVPPPPTPRAFEVRTIGGTNSRGSSSGLQAIWGNCFGQGSWYCAPVYAADPNDYSNLYAVDSVQKVVMVSRDGAETWTEDFGLTNLVTAGGVSMTDSIGNSQVHVFAFDPGNSTHILVGTDHAGIFASANGGQTWTSIPGTAQARAITSFFFDDRTNTIFVGTYGRGLWKLTLDWTTVR